MNTCVPLSMFTELKFTETSWFPIFHFFKCYSTISTIKAYQVVYNICYSLSFLATYLAWTFFMQAIAISKLKLYPVRVQFKKAALGANRNKRVNGGMHIKAHLWRLRLVIDGQLDTTLRPKLSLEPPYWNNKQHSN